VATPNILKNNQVWGEIKLLMLRDRLIDAAPILDIIWYFGDFLALETPVFSLLGKE
jgi:hypothetical protein